MEEFRDIVYITGVSGVGKDYILSECSEELSRKNIGVVNFGNLLVKRTGEMFEDRDIISTLPYEQQEAVIHDCIDSVIQEEPCLLNSHSVIKTGSLFFLDLSLFQSLKPKCYIHVIAQPEVISHRIKKDISEGIRKREIMTYEDIDFHQELSIKITECISAKFGSRFEFISNDDSSNPKKELLTILDEVFT